MNPTMTTTYSMWSSFRNCRKACEWRYLHHVVPAEQDRNLAFGSLIHACLERWHGGQGLDAVCDHIDGACRNRMSNPRQHQAWHLARSMMKGYAARYPDEEFEVVALEKEFRGPIVNPESGRASRAFTLAGKIDGIVRHGDDHFLLEHKTAARIDGEYIERLWTDFQIVLYAYYAREILGIPVTGVIYNILGKARLQQGQGETEGEYEERRRQLAARSKSGKSSAKRKLAEPDDTFAARLATKYTDPSLFHRETIYFSRDQYESLRAELWELTQAFLGARRRGAFYQNTTFCFHYGRPCAYFPLCRSGGSPNVRDNLYVQVPPHEELESANQSTF